MIRKLRFKFVLITMFLVTLILIAVLGGICHFFARTLEWQGYMALEMLLDDPDAALAEPFRVGHAMPERFVRDPVFVAGVDAAGKVRLQRAERVQVSDEHLQDVVQRALATGKARGELKSYNLRFVVRDEGVGETLAFADYSVELAMVRNAVLTLGLVGGAAWLLFLAVSLVLSRWALKPVEKAWTQQRRFVADASHELKTPLTVILANTGILKAHPQDSVQNQMGWVENTEQEAQKMKALVNDLLFLAKSDDAGGKMVVSAVYLSDIVANTALTFEPVAYEHGNTLDIDITPDVYIRGDAGQMRQLVGILLDNAVKYSHPQAAVRLCVWQQQAQACLSVHNSGPPISEEEKPHLFERFYRADPSRTEGGYGLGLAIAKTIVDGHKGKIRVESSAEKGTLFTVSFPLG